MENLEIRNRLKQYGLNYADILPFVENRSHTGPFCHTTRICEELATKISDERRDEYFNAIDKARLKKIEDLKKI